MRYALTASERAFKEAVRGFAGRAMTAPGEPDALPRDLGRWLSAARPDGLSRVEEVVALEEMSRRCPAAAAGLVASGLFRASSPGLCRAAADLGAAEGVLARGLAAAIGPGGRGKAFLQDLADGVTGTEAARLKLYRAAILEDGGRDEPGETAEAERLASDLGRLAGSLRGRIETGGNDEARSAVQESGRNGDRQRPAGF